MDVRLVLDLVQRRGNRWSSLCLVFISADGTNIDASLLDVFDDSDMDLDSSLEYWYSSCL